MAEAESGTLEKLHIFVFDGPEYEGDPVEEWAASFNPSSYSNRFEVEYDEEQAPGTSANALRFGYMKPQELSLEFFLDGTGVAGEKEDVFERVEEFLVKAYEYNGDAHRNRYLRLSWSTLVLDCVLKSAEITYTMFEPSGRPLRAKINATFLEFVNDERRVKKEDDNSPDVTHVRTVEGSERIDQLAHRIYETPAYYVDVARANRLTNFRKLRTGTELTFPPVVETGA